MAKSLEIIASLGDSQNQVTVWNYPSMKIIANRKGHTGSVMYTALSPNGQTMVSEGVDEML